MSLCPQTRILRRHGRTASRRVARITGSLALWQPRAALGRHLASPPPTAVTAPPPRDWFLVALLAPALWAVGNHIDKYLLSNELRLRGIGPLLLFSSLVGLPAIVFIGVLRPGVLSIAPQNAALVVLNGILYVLSLVPYYYALQKDEASIVVPLFQTTAVFSYVFGLTVLGEKLSSPQILACLMIIAGSALLSIELHREQARFKKSVLLLMLLASLLNAVNWLLFKYVAIQEDFWTTSFWEYVGFLSVAVVSLVFVKSFRNDFVCVFRENRFRVLGLVGVNEFVSIGAKTATNVASLTAPLALISTVHGFQPFFVLCYGVFLTLVFPRHVSEDLTRAAILQKVTAVTLTIAGTWLLNT